ncbi:hypothetical protein FT663_00164 [Candidozyma haemuli var. vulneris]|uniref:Uncharacterized protein n=1 Tax=Candidozyma haemuli TaxID=45357 RepID=A0A2V1AMI0_9ASCO|nr:hypothetical protein CXQ85_001044 [[Candida] haemuloni]KAF3994194.1 hypothetical protein FT662_00063 [[Candida] haemuloni var. vulneris]KAF3995742.1 hypothetical protein FT663_00164 [[Candida] haemuloni var. vulneris]PVH18756.1 hypothetical protein CXQ85_001044 [[Candida] haemuloni]
MFTVTRSPLYDFNTLFHTLDSVNQYQQAQQLLQQQYEASRPKIVKKVETEDKYQIQIFKKQGNFNTYEVKVLRNAAYGDSNLINLVIESRRDDFRKVFQFSLNDIEVGDIDWEYFEADNVLVLNVPKKVKYCADDYVNSLLASMLGLPGHQGPPCSPCHGERKERKHKHRRERRHRDKEARLEAARAEAAEAEAKAKAARIEAAKAEAARAEEAARLEAARREAARREAERQRAAEQKAKRAAEEKAKKVAEEKARRLAAVRAKKQEELAKQRSEEQERFNEQLQKQQEFIYSLFGGALPGFQFARPQAQPEKVPEPREAAPQKQESKKQAIPDPVEDSEPLTGSDTDIESETESIHSDISTPDSRSSLKRSGEDLSGSAEKLHRHPSLEEVEDEEFVMFRKKFGDQ